MINVILSQYLVRIKSGYNETFILQHPCNENHIVVAKYKYKI